MAENSSTVTMTNEVNHPITGELIQHVATDVVPNDRLDEYVADAKTRWMKVEVTA